MQTLVKMVANVLKTGEDIRASAHMATNLHSVKVRLTVLRFLRMSQGNIGEVAVRALAST